MKNKIEDGLYYDGYRQYLVVTPKKSKIFSTWKLAKHYFDKWMGKDKFKGK